MIFGRKENDLLKAENDRLRLALTNQSELFSDLLKTAERERSAILDRLMAVLNEKALWAFKTSNANDHYARDPLAMVNGMMAESDDDRRDKEIALMQIQKQFGAG